MNNETYIRWLPGTGKGDGENPGTKAANLGEMMRLGIPVPVGFCVTGQAYRDFIEANRLGEQIPEILASAQGDNLLEIETMTRQVQDIISNGAVPEGIYREVSNAYGTLRQSRVAVRSSAQREDLVQASFAGQYETYLNITGLEFVWQHIKKCWASQWTVQAAYYHKHRDFHQNGYTFAVVIQEMIAAEVSGVMFTVNPVSGKRDEAIISAQWGLGEPVVKGSTIPDEFWADKTSGVIRKKRIAIKEKMATANEEGGTTQVDVPAGKQRRPSLTVSQVKELVKLGNRIEAFFGGPQDIEWALTRERFYILQARPAAVPEEGEAAGTAAVTWENPVQGARWLRTWRIGEWLNEPLSPLSATLLIPLLATAREKGGLGHLGWKLPKGWHLKKPWYCVINGYFYARADLNMLSFLLFLLRDPPRMKKALNHWNAVHLPAYLQRLEDFKRINLSAATSSQLLGYVEELCRDAGEWWYLMALDGGGAGFLEKVFRGFYKTFIAGKNGFDPIVFLRGYDSKILAGERALYNLAREAAGHSDLRHIFSEVEPPEVLSWLETTREGKKFLIQLESYLQTYGHQVYSLDLLFPTLSEDPSRLVPILKRYIADEARKPSENLAGQAAQREEAVQATLARLKRRPLRRRIFQSLLKRVQELVIRREDTVFFFQLGWPLIRKALLELGQRLESARLIDQAQDLFFLSKEELGEAVQRLETGPAGKTRFCQLAEERRELWETQRRLSPPDRIPPAGHPLWQRKGPVYWGEGELHHGPGGAWFSGIAASPGRARGRARVLTSTADFHKLEKGEILVTVALTPAWTPLFSIAAAAVAEAGGVTSHASIVAREYGIPVVMGTGIAGQVIKDGQVISVDGSKGIVYL